MNKNIVGHAEIRTHQLKNQILKNICVNKEKLLGLVNSKIAFKLPVIDLFVFFSKDFFQILFAVLISHSSNIRKRKKCT